CATRSSRCLGAPTTSRCRWSASRARARCARSRAAPSTSAASSRATATVTGPCASPAARDRGCSARCPRRTASSCSSTSAATCSPGPPSGCRCGTGQDGLSAVGPGFGVVLACTDQAPGLLLRQRLSLPQFALHLPRAGLSLDDRVSDGLQLLPRL